MEFFEKQFNVKFVDVKTGKFALDIIKEKQNNKNCCNCKWIINGDGKSLHEEDSVCGNIESEYTTEFVNRETVCQFWENKPCL